MVTPVKAIRTKCLDCSAGSAKEVTLCPITRCPLYPFREGHNPNIARRELTEEQREAARVRLAQNIRFKNQAKSENSPTEGIYTTGTKTAETSPSAV